MNEAVRVLLIDDDPARRELVCIVLSASCRVQAPDQVLDAADQLAAGDFEVAVLGPVAWATPEALVARARRGSPACRVVLMSPELDAPAVALALDLRVDHLVPADARAPLRVRDLLDAPAVAEDARPSRLPESTRTVPGEPVPMPPDVSDAPTQEMTAHRPPSPTLLQAPGPALSPLVQAAGLGCFRARRDGTIDERNDALKAMLGASPPQALGLDSGVWAALVEEARAKGHSAREALHIGEEGRKRLVSLTLRAVDVGDLVLFDGVIVDRSETEALWQRLERLRLGRDQDGGEVIALSDRRAARDAAIDAHTQPALPNPEVEREVGARLAAASHDLQEPLRSVRIYADLLEETAGHTLGTDARDLLDQSRDAARRAELMLGDVMKAAAGQEPVDEEPADGEEVLNSVLAHLRGSMRESGATVTRDKLPAVGLPARELGQLLQNLVGNALKYRSERLPRVHVSAVAEGGQWRFTVGDNGRGIDPEFLPRVFEMFERAPGSGDRPGSGIGLAVCKRVVESHGGSIGVESIVGEGSTFWFTVPDAPQFLAKNVNI